ncbi:MAG: hypothetical protein ACPLSM_06015, partial [Thermosphaera sp.]
MSVQEDRNIPNDVDVIPPTPMKWEYLWIVYLVFVTGLVWYVSENLLVWEPSSSILDLPKPVVGALMIASTWLVVNFLVFTVYYSVLRKRL